MPLHKGWLRKDREEREKSKMARIPSNHSPPVGGGRRKRRHLSTFFLKRVLGRRGGSLVIGKVETVHRSCQNAGANQKESPLRCSDGKEQESRGVGEAKNFRGGKKKHGVRLVVHGKKERLGPVQYEAAHNSSPPSLYPPPQCEEKHNDNGWYMNEPLHLPPFTNPPAFPHVSARVLSGGLMRWCGNSCAGWLRKGGELCPENWLPVVVSGRRVRPVDKVLCGPTEEESGRGGKCAAKGWVERERKKTKKGVVLHLVKK